jgi:hypothetical protein
VSVEAITWAFQQTPANSGLKLLLVALANDAGKHGVTFTGQATLADACSCKRETITRNLALLEEAGYIARVRRTRKNGSRTSDYTVLAPGWPDRGAMITATGEEVPDVVIGMTTPGQCEESSREEIPPTNVRKSGGPEPSEEPSESLGSRARKPVSYRGQRVPREQVDAAERLLAAFSAATGRSLGAFAGDGSPSPSLRQIIGAMRLRPEVTEPEWEQAIRHTVEAPPGFVDGPVQLGHVFGERAADHALANPGRRRGGQPPGASVQSRGVQTGNTTTDRPDYDSAVRWD